MELTFFREHIEGFAEIAKPLRGEKEKGWGE